MSHMFLFLHIPSNIFIGWWLCSWLLYSVVFFFLKFILFIFSFGCIGSSLRCAGFSLQWLVLLRCTGLVAPRHVGTARARARTCVHCIAGRFLTTAPPGKPHCILLNCVRLYSNIKLCYLKSTGLFEALV